MTPLVGTTSSGTVFTATTLPPREEKRSIIADIVGLSPHIRSSGSRTAKASSPTASLAIRTAWPSPSCRSCTTVVVSTMSEIASICRSRSVSPLLSRAASRSGIRWKYRGTASCPGDTTKTM